MSPSSLPSGILTVRTPDEHTRIEILDGNLRDIALDHNLGDVSVQVPYGVYAVRFYQGGEFTERLAALTTDARTVTVNLDETDQPRFATAAPVRGTSTTREWQREPARALSVSEPQTPAGHTGGSRVLLFLRNPFDQSAPVMAGVTLCDLNGTVVFDLDRDGQRDLTQGWVGAHLSLNPGAYRLRRLAADAIVEQIVFTRPQWQTQLFLLASGRTGAPTEVLRTSVLMAKGSVGFDFDRTDLRWTESALRALESRANIPGRINRELLWAKFENPMLGIFGALLHLRRKDIDRGLMKEAFANLYNLVGPLPDVLAIGWAVALLDSRFSVDQEFITTLRDAGRVDTPPMLRESWDYLLRASAREEGLVPEGSLADRLGGRFVSGSPWVAWIYEPSESAPPIVVPKPVEIDPTAPRSSGLSGFFSLVEGFVSKAVTWLRDTALEVSVTQLTKRLRSDPTAHHWLRTRRFTDLERSLAYWIRPEINPQMAGVFVEAPEIEKRVEEAGRARAGDALALLTELNAPAATVLRTIAAVYSKLYVFPVIPDENLLRTFVAKEARGQRLFVATLNGLRRPSELHCPAISRRLSLLEFTRLYYRGSPADGAAARGAVSALATRLAEAEFVFGDAQESVTPAVIIAHHKALRQNVIGRIGGSRSRQVKQLPEGWQSAVFPIVECYKEGQLFPTLESERTDVDKPSSTGSNGSTSGQAVPG